MDSHVFISHSSEDDPFVEELRRALERLDFAVWADSRGLRAGDELGPEIARNIEEASHFLVVLSPNTINSEWVPVEIRKALEVRARRGGAYRVVPVLLPGIKPQALRMWFDEEPVAVRVEAGPGRLAASLPAILAALGESLPDEYRPPQPVASRPVAELRLELTDARVETGEGKRRAAATAGLVYEPPDASARAVRSRRFAFTAPLGPIEAEDLRWYLERYYLWPTGVFAERARRIEEQLPRWGRELFEAALGATAAQAARDAWRHAPEGAERRFTVLVDCDPPEGSSQETLAGARAAAGELLSLPWELLHDEGGYLFEGKGAARVRRTLPNRREQPVRATGLPIRILLASPRPEDARAGYIDHRASALPLVEALEALGELATLTVLTPPTFPALAQALRGAEERGEPYDVVHFDGHGLFDREHLLGGLCFEDPRDAGKPEGRAGHTVGAEELARVVRDHRVPLVFLEACESARTEENPTASVAARLLEGGVTSVVAMSHSVLVETARRFVEAFYERLAQGARVGTAMLAGQLALKEDTYRGPVMGAGELRLQDWFVPVLFQEEQDPRLITELPPDAARELQARSRRLDLGALPAPPPHRFQGRSRELLKLERLLADHPYGVVRGQGGSGKTTLAAELARWLVRTNRHARAAFVSLEHYTDLRAVLDSLGRQLLPGNYSVSQFPDLARAFQPIRRALSNDSAVIVLDNMESVLPDPSGRTTGAVAPVEELFRLCRDLLDSSASTRLLFTTREPLPEPFDQRGREVVIGPLSRDDAVALVSQVMAQEGLTPAPSDPGGTPEEITELVEAADRHARALVLLAREVARRGVRATTDSVRQIMADLHRRHPDDRHRSLYASLELSLRRLPPETRAQLKALAPFHGGAHLGVVADMLGAGAQAVSDLADRLAGVGLAQPAGYWHVRLDPALPPYLLGGMGEAERKETAARWAAGMKRLLSYIHDQQHKNVEAAHYLTLMELPNLMALLEWSREEDTREEMGGVLEVVERLLARVGSPRARARLEQFHGQVAGGLGGWSHVRFLTELRTVERLLERRDLRAAYDAARQLLRQCQAAGDGAFKEAAHDTAVAHFILGTVLRVSGAAADALAQLDEARGRFRALAAGNAMSANMEHKTIGERGDCLRDLGRLEEAEAAYKEAGARAEADGDRAAVAVSAGQLGTVQMMQGRLAEALENFDRVRRIFEGLNEWGSVATAWNQIGMAHLKAEQYGPAEDALRQSLAIKVRLNNLPGQANSMNSLGDLYLRMGRLEEAAECFSRAADIYMELPHPMHEGFARSNLAVVATRLKRYDEARRQLLRAVQCSEPYGHAAKSWMSWDALAKLEQETGDLEASARARRKAVGGYLAYRRDGGESRTPGAALCEMVAEAVGRKDPAEAEKLLAEFLEGEPEPWARALVPKLQALVKGDLNSTRADDPALDYDDAAELLLLLEHLAAGGR